MWTCWRIKPCVACFLRIPKAALKNLLENIGCWLHYLSIDVINSHKFSYLKQCMIIILQRCQSQVKLMSCWVTGFLWGLTSVADRAQILESLGLKSLFLIFCWWRYSQVFRVPSSCLQSCVLPHPKTSKVCWVGIFLTSDIASHRSFSFHFSDTCWLHQVQKIL